MARILVVDDDANLVFVITTYLSRLGHDTVRASDGAGALAALREDAVDLIIADINMPNMDGIELLAAMRLRAVDLPTIVMSGGGKFDTRLLLRSASLLGAVATIEKPFALDELGSLVEDLLA